MKTSLRKLVVSCRFRGLLILIFPHGMSHVTFISKYRYYVPSSFSEENKEVGASRLQSN